MGQYYHPINIDKMEYIYSHDFGNGLKLMEHSYIGNDFVRAVERLLSPKGEWHKSRIVWAGDYMDADLFFTDEIREKIANYNAKGQDAISEDANLFSLADCIFENAFGGHKLLREMDNYNKRRDKADTLTKRWLKTLPEAGKFLVNHSKKICLDLDKEEPFEMYDNNPWTIHPLPLLTSSGNGRGGGDYHREDSLVGSWAGDVISMEYEPMYEVIEPLNFKE